jgi:malate synthase
VWQWIRHGARLEDGRSVTAGLARALLAEEMSRIKFAAGESQYAAGRYERASEIFERLITSHDFIEFLTIPAYDYLG